MALSTRRAAEAEEEQVGAAAELERREAALATSEEDAALVVSALRARETRLEEQEHKLEELYIRWNSSCDPGLEALAAAKPERLLLVIGGEDRSVGQFILNMADDVVGITQRGRINSLNASVAGGIAMFALGQAE